jgi:hypothetical protein
LIQPSAEHQVLPAEPRRLETLEVRIASDPGRGCGDRKGGVLRVGDELARDL